jgi:hypothetical protein
MKSAADELLENAKKAWDINDKGSVDYYCNQILKIYPESNAAKDAQEILDGLPARTVTKPHTSPAAGLQSQSSKYSTARGVAAFIGFLGWITVLGGILSMVYAASQGLGGLGVLLGIGVIIAGFLQVMGAQLVTATLDNADNTGEILALLKARD